MKIYLCQICGHIEFSQPDGNCPVCLAPKEKFEAKENFLKTKGDGDSGGEPEKKHIPTITVVKTCGLIPAGGCTDVHVKIGEIEHPMKQDHFITFIEFFLDKKYLSRVYLTPEKLHPAAALHVNAPSGLLTAVEHCNLHGYWMSETQL